MENTLQLLTDTHSISEYAHEAVAAITEGQIDPLTAFVNINKIKKVIEEVGKNPDVSRILIDHIEMRGVNREMIVGDCKAQVCEAGVTYDFSECGDQQLADLYAEADALKERIKARENFLKGIKSLSTIVTFSTTFPTSFRLQTTETQIRYKNELKNEYQR